MKYLSSDFIQLRLDYLEDINNENIMEVPVV